MKMRVGTTRLVRAAAGALLALAAASVPAQDYHSVFHPQALKGPPAGKPNTVLVLGTPHLSGLPNDYGPGVIEPLLAPLLDRLAAWQPTAIATEDLSGLQCDAMRRYPYRYAETVKVYCTDPAAAARATGLDVPAANAEADRLLLAWPASPTPGQRRHLAAVLLAAGERHSALVQWLRLPVAERHIGDGLDAALAVSLVALQRRRNESGMIAATLAARLGLERLWSVDDHTADTPDDPDPAVGKAYEEAIAKAWDNPASAARRAEDMRLQAGLGRSGGMLALYRAINVPGAADRVYQSDFGAALTEGSPQGFGRHYVGYWETRNLRMAANVRDVLGRYPGTRMLALVGASHKGYYEAYLDQMHDVRLADAEDVLTP